MGTGELLYEHSRTGTHSSTREHLHTQAAALSDKSAHSRTRADTRGHRVGVNTAPLSAGDRFISLPLNETRLIGYASPIRGVFTEAARWQGERATVGARCGVGRDGAGRGWSGEERVKGESQTGVTSEAEVIAARRKPLERVGVYSAALQRSSYYSKQYAPHGQ